MYMSLLKCLMSIEAIDYQANSLFPKKLEEIFQKILNFANQHDELHGEVDTSNKAADKHAKIADLINYEICNELSDVVKHFTGVTVSKITNVLPTKTSDIIDICIFTTMSGQAAAASLAATGVDISNRDDITLEKLLDIRKQLNRDKGYINHHTDISIEIILPVGLFVIKDILPKYAHKLQPSASEITSVFLHEIGHLFSLIEYIADMSYVGYYGNNVLRNVSDRLAKDRTKTIKEVVELGEANLNKITNKTKKLFVTNAIRTLKRMNQLLNLEDYAADSVKNMYIENSKNYITKTLVIIVIVIMFQAFDTVSAILLDDLLALLENNRYTNTRERSSHKNNSMFERLADEYVSRYSMSKSLNSCLIKLYKIDNEINKLGYVIPIYDKAIRNHMLTALITRLLIIPVNVFTYIKSIKTDNLSSKYEPIEIRLQRSINNNMDILKDIRLDPIIKEQLVRDLEEMMFELKTYSNKSVPNRLFEKVIRFVVNLPADILIKAPMYIFGSANLDKEYSELFEHLDNMLSNKSFYYAAKISGALK